MYAEEGDTFRLRENLLIIGTMNTADRSIGLIDAALRRRFHFVPLFPGRYPLESTLRDWLAENRPEMRHVAGIVDALNAKLVDRLGPHLQVGHSHFFRSDLSTTVLEEIWRHDILPFLQDQLYGHEDELAEFDLSRFIEESGADAAADGVATDDSSSDE
jgi:5-methylcytosine-specific restriction protein B